jgi:hypothetical protein
MHIEIDTRRGGKRKGDKAEVLLQPWKQGAM